VAREISTRTSTGPHLGSGSSAIWNGRFGSLKMAQRAVRTSPGKTEGFYKAIRFDGFDHAFFDSKTAVLNPPKWAGFDAKSRNFVYVHGSAAQSFDGFQSMVIGSE